MPYIYIYIFGDKYNNSIYYSHIENYVNIMNKSMITLTNYTILTFLLFTSLGGTFCPFEWENYDRTTLSEKIMIELLFEEERNHVFKLRLTILIYEYLFVMIV